MSSTHESLVRLVEDLLAESEKRPEGPLRDETSLIASGLLDSLALLQIAEWISEQLGGALDLESVDVRTEWDSVADILAFLARRTA